jgi:hypothetical protein
MTRAELQLPGHPETQIFTMRYRSWLRRCATSRKVAGSITDQTAGFSFDLPSPSNPV